MRIGYHASHEQFSPGDLLHLVQEAQRAGFQAIQSSDHLAPWSRAQGHSGLTFAWLGAAMAMTRVPFAVVTAPGQRYHPVITAQAIATLGQMFPGRLTPFLGSGQALNEHVTGDLWPTKAVRNARLAECADVIGRLLGGQEVDHDGLVRVHVARLWTLPEVVPPLMAAALTEPTARDVGRWARGLITLHGAGDSAERVIAAFREVAGPDAPVSVQIHVSWRETLEQARRDALDQWRTNALPAVLTEELQTPEQFEAASRHVGPDDLADSVVMTDDVEEIAAVIQRYRHAGVAGVYLHQVGRDQEDFLRRAGRDLLPLVVGE